MTDQTPDADLPDEDEFKEPNLEDLPAEEPDGDLQDSALEVAPEGEGEEAWSYEDNAHNEPGEGEDDQ